MNVIPLTSLFWSMKRTERIFAFSLAHTTFKVGFHRSILTIYWKQNDSFGRPDPSDALSCGADIVVQSAHKSLSSLSQTALMHLNTIAFSFQTDLHPEDVESIVDDSFSALTTTSPNSLLLASLDASLAEYQHSGTETLESLCALAETLKATLKKQGICRLINDLKLNANDVT